MKNKLKDIIPEGFEELIDGSVEIKMISRMPLSTKINEKRCYKRLYQKKK